MTAFGLYPTFTDREGYREWRQAWSATYKALSSDIRARKHRVKDLQRAFTEWYDSVSHQCAPDPQTTEQANLLAPNQRELRQHRAVATKMMTLLNEAKLRRDRILKMHADLKEQEKLFPLDLGECRNIDFHFNRGHADFPFLPMWTIRAKGRSYYVHEVSLDAPCSTHERASGSTKGVLRFSRAHVSIDRDGTGHVTTAVFVDEKEDAA